MFKNNWFLIDKFWFNLANVLNEFMDSEKKRILFSFYIFDLDDCPEEDSDYSRDDCISEGFEYFKDFYGHITYNDLENKVKDMLCEEYTRIFEKCEVSTGDELYKMFLNDEISIFNECFIYSIKEFVTREMFANEEMLDFINERKVLENNIDVSFTYNRLFKGDIEKRDLKYVWYEPKSKEDFYEVVKKAGYLCSCIITEDIDNFDNYLYAIECLEQGNYLLAINDRVGNFESEILPKIKGFLREENVILKEKAYFRIIKKSYNDEILNKDE